VEAWALRALPMLLAAGEAAPRGYAYRDLAAWMITAAIQPGPRRRRTQDGTGVAE
jgi:hypothetical protein